MQQVLSAMRKAIEKYEMIKDGDKICIGISGGKDSMLLATTLKAYQHFSPTNFELIAINIDMGFDNLDLNELESIKTHFKNIGLNFIVEKTNIAEIIFDIRKEKNPCSLCSKMRRGALNTSAIKHGCNKIALGHHADDIIETFYLSLFHEGRLSTFMPTSYMDRTKIELIRPFIFLEEHEIKWAVNRLSIPTLHNPCPSDKHTRREDMKELIKILNNQFPDSKKLTLRAIYHPERNNLWPKK